MGPAIVSCSMGEDAGSQTQQSQGRPKRWRTWIVDIGLAVAALALLSAWQERGLLPVDGATAPSFTLPDIQGEPVRLSDFEGRAVQLHFWATWCGVCRREHDALNALAARHGDDQVLIAIAVDSGDAESLATYAEEHGLGYRVLIDDGHVRSAYQVSRFPTDYTLSSNHHIVGRHVGRATRWGMSRRLAAAARHESGPDATSAIDNVAPL